MTGNVLLRYSLFAAVLAGVAGCRDSGIPGSDVGTGVLKVELGVSGMDSRTADDAGEYVVNDVVAYRFAGGVLKERLSPERTEGNTYTFHAESMEGRLYVVANASGVDDFAGSPEPGWKESDFVSLTASLDDMTGHGLLMTGSVLLEEVTSGYVRIPVTRSVCRLDISTLEKDVHILEVRVEGLPQKGVIFAGTDIPALPDALYTELYEDFSAAPLVNCVRRLTYIPETSGSAVKAEVTISSGGGVHRLRAVLPSSLRRNTRYTLQIKGFGADAVISVTEGSWEAGDISGTGPVLNGLVDIGSSDVPSGVRVSESRDTVYVPHSGAEFRLALSALPGSSVDIDGNVAGVDVSVEKTGRNSLENVAFVTVSSGLRFPGSKTERIHLDICDNDMSVGRVVLVFEKNPVELAGRLELDSEGRCDFNEYVEGELGTVSVPAGMTARLEFADGESRWMMLGRGDIAGGGYTYRLVAGWKPNDPKADGRRQTAMVVITSDDGTEESYEISRINWGLPVVRIGDTWWTRYNLRGNVKDFRDQITMADSPVSDLDLKDYLVSLQDDALLDIMGDQYQAGKHQGMPLAHNGTSFYFEGITQWTQSFSQLDASEMAPEGYRIPQYSDFAYLVPTDNYNLGGEGTRTYDNREGRSFSISITEKDVAFLGHHYGTVAFYEFRHGDSCLVLYGHGHQWNTTAGNIAVMNQIFATMGESNQTWNIEGYSKDSKPGENWLKYVAHNAVKTRTIRCIKTPVEYVYD